MDSPQLAAQVLKILAPFLMAGGTAAAGEIGKKSADLAWRKAQELWDKMKPKVEANPDADRAVKYLTEHPEDEDAYPALRLQVKMLLLENPSLAAEVEQIIQAGDYSVVVGKDMIGSKVAVGQNPQVADHIFNTNIYGEKTTSAPVLVEQLTREYLQALIVECEKLPLGAIHFTLEEAEHEASISLEDVYIDLDVRPRPRGKGEMSLRVAPRRHEAIPGGMQEMEREPQRIPVIEALTDENLRRVVLLGEAGSGKTTCVHYLTIALSAIQQKAIAKKPLPEGSALARYFPIRLVLRDAVFPTDAETGGVDILWNALRGDLAKKIGKAQADQLFPHLQTRIKTTPCLIMLDGLDEVPESEERRPRLLEAIQNFAAPLEQSIVMVTARPYAYHNPKWHLPRFETLDLLSFSKEQIEGFISRFYDSVQIVKNWDDTMVALRKRDLNEAVQSREYLYKLAERPLLLTLIASVDSSGAKLPEGRAELYMQTIDLLLQRWHLRKGSGFTEQEIVRFFSSNTDKVLDILQRLAYKVHERQGRQEQPREDAPADIERDEVWSAFAPSLPREIDADSLLTFLEKRAGLLLDRGKGVYVFPHRSFQEYLAAGFLNTQSDEKYHLDAVFRRGPKWWREVVLLGIARMSGSLKNAADEVNSLVPCDPGEMGGEITPTDWQVADLAGQALLEMRLKEKGGDQIKYKTIIKRVAKWLAQLLEGSRLTPRERAEAGNTLAKLGDPRPGVLPHPRPLSLRERGERGEGINLLLCEIPAGKFWMGSKKGEKDSSDDEYPRFEYTIPHNYFMSRYPVTNAQFEVFVKDPEGYTKNDWWTKAGLDWRKDRTEHNRYGGVFALPNHPVVGVTWYEAHAFCNWLTEQAQKQVTGYELQVYDPKTRVIGVDDNLKSSIVNRKSVIRLPTEAEWERAARGRLPSPSGRGGGGEGHRFPWGDEITPDHANYTDTNLNTTSAVGAFPLGMNDYGLLDMSGNVWEWCATAWQENYENYLKNEKENNKPEGDVARVVRGGSYDDAGWLLRCAGRDRISPDFEWDYQGFRVVVCASFLLSP